MMKQKINTENFEAWNEEMAARYDVDLFHNHPSPLVRFIERKRVRKVLQFLSAQPHEKILEVGCGAGNVLEKIPQGELSGIDLCDSFVARAQKRLGGRAEIRKGNAEQLPYGDNAFDKIYCTEVLEHVLDPSKVLKEMVRVAKDQAFIVISIPYERVVHFCKWMMVKLGIFDLVLRKKKDQAYQMHERMQDEWHLRECSLKFLQELVPPEFCQMKVSRLPFFGLPLHYVVLYQLKKNV